MSKLTYEFTKYLNILSTCRAGDDYELSSKQKAEEDRQRDESLSRLRQMWSENPAEHDDLRQAFIKASPLATMEEIERP